MSNVVRTKIKDLNVGDVVLVTIPFEENTSDYYNGHNVFDIISSRIRNRDGLPGKTRPAVVMGSDPSNLYVAPLTTQTSSDHDTLHQVELHYTPELLVDTHSFAEITSMRRVIIDNEKSLRKIATLNEKDLENIKAHYDVVQHKGFVAHNEINNHTYVNDKESFFTQLEEHGYEKVGNDYKKGNRTVVDKQGNIVTYEREVPLIDVLHRTHPNTHFTLRTGDRQPVSAIVDALVEDTRTVLDEKGVGLSFDSTTHLPNSLDAMTKRGRTNILIKAGNDHGAIRECGNILLASQRIHPDKLDSFVTWFEETRELDVVNPQQISQEDKNLFEKMDLTIILTPSDLLDHEDELSQ